MCTLIFQIALRYDAIFHELKEITLEHGREKSLLADYVYALRSKVDRVNKYKVARL